MSMSISSPSPKLVFLIADGMGDLPIDALGGRTPMEAADTPAMDRLARLGRVGLCRTVPAGMAPGSDVANMSLLGFDPASHHTGRGPIEAAAMGLVLGAEDVVFRLNTVTVSEFSDSGLMRDYSAGHIDTAVSTELVKGLAASCLPAGYELHPGVQYRHLLVAKGAAGREEATVFVRPPHDITDQPIAPDLAELERVPALWRFATCAAKLLAGNDNPSKANAVWPWGQGRALTLPSFAGTFGLRGAVVSAVDLVKGLGRAAGMAVLDVPGATGLLDTNYEGKVAAALDYLKDGDFVFVHVEAPDECGHGGDAAAKTEAVARFDARVVAPMLAALGESASVLIACDHPTPIAVRTHTVDPVPFLFWKAGIAANGATAFSEREAAGTGLLIEPGHTLLPQAAAWASR